MDRHIRDSDEYLDVLRRFVKSNNSKPTKEYLTTRLIRCIIKIFKFIHKNKIPDKTAIKIDPKNSLQNECWYKLVKLYQENQGRFLDNIEKNKFNLRPRLNASFCKNFFCEEFSKNALKILLKLFYSDPNPSILSQRFNFSCCLNSEHSIHCISKWSDLEYFLNTSFLKSY